MSQKTSIFFFEIAKVYKNYASKKKANVLKVVGLILFF